MALALLFVAGITIMALRATNGSPRADQGISASDASAQGPYRNSGPNARDDNFFIPGKVTSLESLADQSKKATVVWVSASWCEICHVMRPFVWKVANKYAESIALKEIDYDRNPEIIRTYGIYGTPMFLVLDRSGQIISRFSGATQESFEARFDQITQRS